LVLEPDEPTRRRIATEVGVNALESLQARVALRSWLDGAEVQGTLTAVVSQTCGLTLESFQSELRSEFLVRVIPAGSPNAPDPDLKEVAVDPEAEDPPEVLDGDSLDVGAYVVEYLALEIDPFPRKPGAVFEPPDGPDVISPFAALAALKGTIN
jgi:hypothetical protein